MEWKDFILQHDGDDLARLVLSRDKYPGVDVALAATTLECRRRLRLKVPEWYACPELVFPLRLSAEQCSSSAAARYKARLAAAWAAPEGEPARSKRIADLTGGLGVDSWAFHELFGEVLYNEMLPSLADAARQNFGTLGAGNVRVRCARVERGAVAEILGDFHPDVIYLDPARRGALGRKVFLLEDCSPDVTALMPELLDAAPVILLKLSPMADISMLLRRLPHVREVHVVSGGGECKELLLVVERGFSGEAEIVAESLRFRRSEEAAAVPAFGIPQAGDLLFEPGKGFSKAGCFNLVSARYALRKIGRNTHLYLWDGKDSGQPDLPGKWFRILEVLPLDKRGVAVAGAAYPGADVSARGVPLSTEELASRLRKAGRKTSGNAGEGIHLFGVQCGEHGDNLLLAAKK